MYLASSAGVMAVVAVICLGILILGGVFGSKRSKGQARGELGGCIVFGGVLVLILIIVIAVVASSR